ncbi:hypothetical protein GIS00_02390 [Nakamurella sp. YIM 132087]|uniref:Uncharacterized protein n=1 Tax=Nakamurella alba TaxID=2665158 RepID=A0A7K1FHN2_9ACTN|nr:hypothetical protein [Nakamurella alba]MTD12793.1 hypothetical protein [Nakamurella alba]
MGWWMRKDGLPRWLGTTSLSGSIVLTLTWTGLWLIQVLGDREVDVLFVLFAYVCLPVLILCYTATAIYLLRHPEKRTYTLSAARREREAEERRKTDEAEAVEEAR